MKKNFVRADSVRLRPRSMPMPLLAARQAALGPLPDTSQAWPSKSPASSRPPQTWVERRAGDPSPTTPWINAVFALCRAAPSWLHFRLPLSGPWLPGCASSSSLDSPVAVNS
ncbi:hypothetical protein CDD83_10187 [Cordyceps sp. RAO-2017]|nr:hypothetical protein CDD83_10187 [Cordyceps sp. RAO-2017]